MQDAAEVQGAADGDPPLRFGVAGGRRGASLTQGLLTVRGAAVAAVCDPDEAVLARWRERVPGAAGVTRYEALLERPDVDVVLVATPMPLHAAHAIAALRAGKHVLCEVAAASTLDECWALIGAVEASGRTYMLAENCCYFPANLLVRDLVARGRFGQITYAEGAYIHDTRDLSFTPSGGLTWRGELRRDVNGNTYPTHALGPVAQWAGAAGPDATDRLVETCTWVAPQAGHTRYARERFGAAHPGADPGFWAGGDSAVTLIRTSGGALIWLRHDTASPRPALTTHFGLQGTAGAYVAGRHHGESPLIWIEGRSPGTSPERAAWQPLWDYAREHEPDLWQRYGADAAQGQSGGHGDADRLTLAAFVAAVRSGAPAPVDVYDAVTWSSILPLSAASTARGGATVAIPAFRPAPSGSA